MKALAAAYAAVALLAMPAMLWAADDPPSDPAAATTPASPPAALAQTPEEVTTAAPAPAPATTPAPIAPATTTPAPAAKSDAVDTHLTVRQTPPARAASASSVTIKNFAFGPATVNVSVGDTVTWTNQDGAPHTATANDGSFDTGQLTKGKSGSHTFSKAGTFAYICSVHPNMKGTVVVKAASSGSSGSGSSGGSSDGGSSGDSSASSSSSDPFTASDSSSGSDAASSSSSLPNTGLDAGMVALAGLLLIGGGALLRRRLDRAAE